MGTAILPVVRGTFMENVNLYWNIAEGTTAKAQGTTAIVVCTSEIGPRYQASTFTNSAKCYLLQLKIVCARLVFVRLRKKEYGFLPLQGAF